MSSKCIVTQGHIPEFDVQGNLNPEQKQDVFDLSIRHLRYNNPDAFIIVTGHGARPRELDLADAVVWRDDCYPVGPGGYLLNMPAQFVSVHAGLEIAIEKGFERVLKTRLDCLIGREDAVQWSEDILQKEDKTMLLTQQTGSWRIGDCFMYGDLDKLDKTWHKDNPIYNADGLINTAMYFSKAYEFTNDWNTSLRKHVAFRDVIDIPFADLRWNYHSLVNDYGWDEVVESVMNDTMDLRDIHWGKINGWHEFDNDGNMTKTYSPLFWSRKEFYEEN